MVNITEIRLHNKVVFVNQKVIATPELYIHLLVPI